MGNILPEYQMNEATWAYLSSLIMIAVYFKFRRFWSVRNLDLMALIAFARGLYLISDGRSPLGHLWEQQAGFVWLFGVGGFFLARLLLDATMVRRPLLEPNLSAGGLAFAAAAMLVFLASNVITPKPTESDVEGAQWMNRLLAREDSREIRKYLDEHGPGYPLFVVFSTFSDKPFEAKNQLDEVKLNRAYPRLATTRTAAILAHLAVVLAIVLIGYRHFDNFHTGMAGAWLYLLLPYTASYTPRLDHIIPAALLVWAVEAYRRPAVAGILLGLAGGLIYYPLYLVPLWCSFYWRRGLLRFLLGLLLTLLVMVGLLALVAADMNSFIFQLQQMFGLTIKMEKTLMHGFWEWHNPVFRITVFAGFVVLCGGMVLWPAQKNLGTLLSCSAAVMLGSQFWKAWDGGLYMAWYLPLLILTILRPNLEDRVALSAVNEGWRPRKKR
jgi:hypothetical protein